MEINQEHYDEIATILAKHPDGIGFVELYDKATLFRDTIHLSACLHHVIRAGNCYKRSGLYFETLEKAAERAIDVVAKTPKTVDEEIRELLKTNPETAAVMDTTEVPATPEPIGKVVVTEQKFTEVKPIAAPKSGHRAVKKDKPDTRPTLVKDGKKLPMGSLYRTGFKGVMCYALWKFRRYDGLTHEQIASLIVLTDYTETARYQSYSTAVRDGYITRDVNGYGKPVYRWNFAFGYPFQAMQADDCLLLKMTPDEFFEQQPKAAEVVVPEAVPEVPAVITQEETDDTDEQQPDLSAEVSTNHTLLKMIDFKLAHYQQEIDSLQAMKRLLLNSESSCVSG